jgi:hypothetical protein
MLQREAPNELLQLRRGALGAVVAHHRRLRPSELERLLNPKRTSAARIVVSSSQCTT